MIAVNENNEDHIYYTNDGGSNVSFKYKVGIIGCRRKMEFISNAKGFIIDCNQNMYVIENEFIKPGSCTRKTIISINHFEIGT